MARRLKLYPVGRVHTPTAGMVDVFYDRNVTAFTANVRGIEVSGSTLEECKQKVKATAPQTADLQWKQYIVVRKKGRYWNANDRTYFEAERVEIAAAPGGGYVSRDFHPAPGDPDPCDSRFKPNDNIQSTYRTEVTTDECQMVFPYSQSAWAEVLRVRRFLDYHDQVLALLLERADIVLPTRRGVEFLRGCLLTEQPVARRSR